MKTFKLHCICIVTWLAAACGTAYADEQMEEIIASAAPYMHHSCASVLAEYEDDQEQVSQIVRLMAMVSLYNRQIDVVATVQEEYLDDLRGEFVKELEEACDNDGGRLLAGAVDDAVRDTIEEFAG